MQKKNRPPTQNGFLICDRYISRINNPTFIWENEKSWLSPRSQTFFAAFFVQLLFHFFFFAKIVSLLLFLIFVDQRRSNHAAKGLDCGFLMMQSDLGSDRYSGRKSTNHFIVGHTHFFFRVGGPSPPRHPGMALLKYRKRRTKNFTRYLVEIKTQSRSYG